MNSEKDTAAQQTAQVRDDEEMQVGNSQTTRGEFLKWGTVALGGLYVGPKVTSFAVDKAVGQAGSPAPTAHTPTPVEVLPTTGGAAGEASAQTHGVPPWLPLAGVGAAAAGVYARNRAKSPQTAKVEGGDAKKAD